MNKKIIKDRLTATFLKETATPGISVTDKNKKASDKINKAGVKAMEKDVKSYDKALKQQAKDKVGPNKFSYDDKFQKTYHDEMEILNGQEMIQYDSKPNEEFIKKAKEGIEGSSRMGNEGKIGNAEEAWNASSDDFGKNLVKRVKSSTKKRSQETPTLNLRGRDIQADIKDTGHKPYAIEGKNNNNKTQIKESMKRLRFKKEFNGLGNALKLIPEGYKVANKEFEMTDGNETYRIRWEGNLSEGKAIVLLANDKKLVNEDITRMKALFGYKSQDTLGLVRGNARVDENKVFGDIWKKSRVLLGESEEIEGAKASEGDLDDAVSQAPEAKKHVEGSVSTEKGTKAPAAKVADADKAVSQAKEAKKHVEGSVSTEKGTKAPKPKEGNWEDNVKGQAAEAKKHVHLKETESDEEIMEEEELDIMEATPMVYEEEGEEVEKDEEGDEGEETPNDDNWGGDDSDSSTEAEPTATDIKPEVPSIAADDDDDDEESIQIPVSAPKKNMAAVKLLSSQSTGEFFISINGKNERVPNEFLAIASDRSIKADKRAMMIKNKMDAMKSEPQMDDQDGLDEYAETHQDPKTGKIHSTVKK